MAVNNIHSGEDDATTPTNSPPPSALAYLRPTASRKASVASSVVSVPTPTRELSTRQGAFTNNILRLEQSAEKMSEGGSDIGEEIRRMNELERQRSRQNSIQSSHQGDSIPGRTVPLEVSRSRSGSQARSIVDVNGNARWGGYSPGGYVTSPVGSIRSHGSWAGHASMNRKPSTSSRLAQMIEPVQEGRPLDSPLAPSSSSYIGAGSVSRQASQASHISESSFGKRYDQIAGQIQQHLEDVPPTPPRDEFGETFRHDGHEESEEQRPGTATPPPRPASTDTYREAQLAFKDFDGVHFSPEREEFVALDEEGNEIRRVSARNSSGNLTMSAASLLRAPQDRPKSYAAPPPGEDMIYYPAPVPRMLNLPKRLSQLPAANVQAKRRTQILSQLPPGARQSAPWLSQTDFGGSGTSQRSGSGSYGRPGSGAGSYERPGSGAGSHQDRNYSQPRGALNERMSLANLQNLPPQLRASVFFDHQSIAQNIDIQHESAVATLDNILAASVTAPVSAFTDHPYAGDIRKSAYAPERAAQRQSTTTLVSQAANSAAGADTASVAAERKLNKRSSLAMLLKRNSSADLLGDEARAPESRRSSMLLDLNGGGRKLQKRKSQLSLGGELDLAQGVPLPKTPAEELDMSGGLVAQAQNMSPQTERRLPSGSRPGTAMSGKSKMLTESEQIQRDWDAQAEEDDVEEEEEVGEASFVQPATLLAELQVRKAQLKSRNRTAATAYPNGMHSTLLELDAVQEINTRKRRGQKVKLAWEDPNNNALQQQQELEEDEDVPLGVLYPSKNGLATRKMNDDRDWDRPLGLMEKRELEDSEPLSSRMNRLQGRKPVPRSMLNKSGILPTASQLYLAGQPDTAAEGEAEPEDEHEGETLAVRLQRLRTKKALDGAISDVAPKDGERPVSTWTDDVLSQFGGLDGKKDATAGAEPKPPAAAPTPEDLESETLGQRRARLQREREANGGLRNVSDGANNTTAAARPGLRSSVSMANLLTTNPTGANRKSSANYTPTAGTLLHASAQQQDKHKRQLLNTNIRSSSYGIDRPLVNPQAGTNTRAAMAGTTGLLGQQTPGYAAANSGGFQQGRYNTGIPGGMQTSASTPMFGLQGNNYFASPTAGYYNPQLQHQSMMGFPQQQFNPAAYGALTGGGFGYGYGQQMGYNAMGVGMPMGMMEEQMTPQQRANIDRWRLSVAQ